MNTKIFKIDPSNIDVVAEESLKAAGKSLADGKLVVFPTETVYGLGADGTNPDAARRIYEAKGRPSDNPLIIHIAEPSDAEQYAYTEPMYYALAAAFMPGPLTVVLPAKDSVPKTVTAGLSTVAIRCPSHPIAHRLIEFAGRAIAAPSANLSGSPSPTCGDHAISDMNGRVDIIIDGGECSVGLESTIVKIDDGRLTLLRPGGITPEELSIFDPELKIADAVLGALPEGTRPLSPGMKYKHYAPQAPLVLLDGDNEQIFKYISRQTDKFGMICYREEVEIYVRRGVPRERVFVLGSRNDLAEQARNLFAVLRETDRFSLDCLFAPMPSYQGLGMAVYNRMIRAAAHQIIKL